MKAHVKDLKPRDPRSNARGTSDDAQDEGSGERKRRPLHTVLAILVLPLSLGLALLVGIAALAVAVKRLAARVGASR